MAEITTTEVVHEDGNRATTIYLDGIPAVIVTMGDGETPEDYWENYQAAIAAAIEAATPPDASYWDELAAQMEGYDDAWFGGDDESAAARKGERGDE